MWTDATRVKYARKGLRYSSDMTDAEWAVLEPRRPAASRLGRPRKSLREIVDAALWFALADVAEGFSARLDRAALFLRLARQWFISFINHLLLMAVREAIGRDVSPRAGVIDSQIVKTTEAGGPRGYDAGKKAKGRKRHIVTDTSGLMVGAVVHETSIQDRDGTPAVLASIRATFPWLRHIFAHGGYAGDKLETALVGEGDWTLEIIKRSDTAQGFERLPRRWVVERTFAWLNETDASLRTWVRRDGAGG